MIWRRVPACLAQPVRHAAAVRATIELDICPAVVAHVRLELGAVRDAHCDVRPREVRPHSAVLVAHAAAALVEERGPGGEGDLDAFAVAGCDEGRGVLAGGGVLRGCSCCHGGWMMVGCDDVILVLAVRFNKAYLF